MRHYDKPPAVFGAPFLIWRTSVAARQTAIVEESPFNAMINAAALDPLVTRQPNYRQPSP